MGKEAAPIKPPDSTYQQRTRLPLNNLALVGPLLLIYHVGALWCGAGRVLLAPRYLQDVLDYFGATATVLPPLLVVAALLMQHILHHYPWRISVETLAGMIGESMLWTAPLIAASFLRSRLAGVVMSMSFGQDVLPAVLKAVGAGVYEEFLFRMVLISLLLLLAIDVARLRKDACTVTAVILAAVVFSLCHFSLLGGAESFAWGSFVFRTLAGVLFGTAYVFRGLGIAVGAHIFWNLFVYLA